MSRTTEKINKEKRKKILKGLTAVGGAAVIGAAISSPALANAFDVKVNPFTGKPDMVTQALWTRTNNVLSPTSTSDRVTISPDTYTIDHSGVLSTVQTTNKSRVTGLAGIAIDPASGQGRGKMIGLHGQIQCLNVEGKASAGVLGTDQDPNDSNTSSNSSPYTLRQSWQVGTAGLVKNGSSDHTSGVGIYGGATGFTNNYGGYFEGDIGLYVTGTTVALLTSGFNQLSGGDTIVTEKFGTGGLWSAPSGSNADDQYFHLGTDATGVNGAFNLVDGSNGEKMLQADLTGINILTTDTVTPSLFFRDVTGLDTTRGNSVAVGTITAQINSSTGNATFTDLVTVNGVDPEVRLVDSGNSEYTRVTKSDANNLAARYNRVDVAGLATWTPAEITTDAWYDASDASTIIESGGAVSQWNDKSGNSRNVAQGTAANQPSTGVNTLNGLNVITCVDDSMEATSNWVDYTNGLEAFVVFKPTGTGTDLLLAAWTNNNNARFQVIYKGTDDVLEWRALSGSSGVDFIGRKTDTSEFVASTAYQLGCTYNGGTSASDLKIFSNGTQVDTTDTTSGSFSKEAGVSGEPFDVGSQSDAGNQYSGDIAEIIYIQDTSSTATRQKIEGYLAWKWGLEGDLPVGHPYKSAAPVGGSTPMEVDVWKSQDSAVDGEYGVQTFGDDDGQNIIAGQADKAQLQNQPTGGTDLSIATTKYVGDNTFWDRSGTILSPETSGDSLEIDAAATFNTDAGDNDFTINSQTGTAYVYNAGTDVHNFTNEISGDWIVLSGNPNTGIKSGFDVDISGLGVGRSSPIRATYNDSSTNLTGAISGVSIANNNTADGSYSGLTFNTKDTGGTAIVASFLHGVHTSHAAGAVSSDVVIGTRNAGSLSARTRIVSDGTLQHEGAAIFNNEAGDNDFSILKNVTSTAYIYNAGADTHTFDGDTTISDSILSVSQTAGAAYSIINRTDGDIGGIVATSNSVDIRYDDGGTFKIRTQPRADLEAGTGTNVSDIVTIDSSGNAIFNASSTDSDFEILKNVSGTAYKYDSGLATHTYTGDVTMESTVSSADLTWDDGGSFKVGSQTASTVANDSIIEARRKDDSSNDVSAGTFWVKRTTGDGDTSGVLSLVDCNNSSLVRHSIGLRADVQRIGSLANTSSAAGVYGCLSSSGGAPDYGVDGDIPSNYAIGVYGCSEVAQWTNSINVGIYGVASNGDSGSYAGYFDGNVLFTNGNALFNADAGDYDFTINKNTSGSSLVYDAGDDDFTFDSPIILDASTTTTAPLTFQSGTLMTTPVTGSMEFDGQRLYFTEGDAERRVVSLSSDVKVSDTTVANTTTETTLYTVDVQSESTAAGKMYKIPLFGKFSTGSAAHTLTLRFKIDGTTLTVPFTGKVVTDAPWNADFVIIIRTTGASGTFASNVSCTADNSSFDVTPTTGSIDTTVTTTLSVTAQWSDASASNTITCMGAILEDLN